jgi:hypothetical protein
VTNANEHLSLDPIGKVVASYSDVDMSQKQEISSFFRENFFQRFKQGYSSDSASEASIYAHQQRRDEQVLRWTLSEQLFIPV